MNKIHYFIGIDISAADFTVSIFTLPTDPIQTHEPFTNSTEGFQEFEQWLNKQHIIAGNSVICLEATGVYGEKLCYFLSAKGYYLAIEPPLKVKRAFDIKGHKNEPVDSKQIAEYAYRFQDELKPWQPKSETIEQIRVLLGVREQFVQQKTANINALHALERKVVQTPLANEYYQNNIQRLSEQVNNIEKEIQRLIDQDSHFRKTVALLKTIPGVGLLLAANLLVITNGFQQMLFYKQLAAYIGICPYEHRSGKSVYRKPQSAHFGPARLRKLLRLAARSVKTHKKSFRLYFLQKQAQGKETSLILNNISNKLLKIICAVINSQKPYLENYQSLNPTLINLT
jgi:transposase